MAHMSRTEPDNRRTSPDLSARCIRTALPGQTRTTPFRGVLSCPGWPEHPKSLRGAMLARTASVFRSAGNRGWRPQHEERTI
jgi:hypothetical protein